MSRRIEELERRYAGDPASLELIAAEKQEIDLYREASDSYGYVFFILRKAETVGA
jgi:hypothetical protein